MGLNYRYVRLLHNVSSVLYCWTIDPALLISIYYKCYLLTLISILCQFRVLFSVEYLEPTNIRWDFNFVFLCFMCAYIDGDSHFVLLSIIQWYSEEKSVTNWGFPMMLWIEIFGKSRKVKDYKLLLYSWLINSLISNQLSFWDG